MYYCVTYDISSNRLRGRASKWCRQAGLERLQRSVFVGESEPERIEELESRLRPLLPRSDQFVVMPIDRSTYINLMKNSRLPLADAIEKPIVFWQF